MENRIRPIRTDLLCRLRWNLLADLHDIEIAGGPNEKESVISLFDHSSADEGLAIPSLSRIEVGSAECLDKYDLSFDGSPEPDGYRPPPSLVIENRDGGSITVRQFVTEVHAYMNEHMDEIKKALGGIYTTPVDEMNMVFFRRAWAVESPDDNNVRLYVSLEPTAERTSMEQFWATQLHQARMDDRQRHRQYAGVASLAIRKPGSTAEAVGVYINTGLTGPDDVGRKGYALEKWWNEG